MTYNVAPNFNSEREEFLYESCLKNPDLLATLITEYITRLSVTDLSELDDFLTNNFGDNWWHLTKNNSPNWLRTMFHKL